MATSYEVTIPVDKLAAALHGMASRTIPAICLQTARFAMEDLFLDIAKTWPKGSVGTSPHPGKSAASIKASLEEPAFARLPDASSYPRLGITEVRPITDAMKLGDTGFITDDARSDGAKRGYADILEAGRHVDSRGRLAGSTQAPDGIFGPAILRLIANSGLILRRAVAQVLNQLGTGA